MAARPQVYQIDFTAVASGKRIASTKRRVRWRFGFANPEALANGETGTACRGEEHDVTIVWSITSGKRLVLADGQEVHYSNSRSNLFEFSWTMKGNHVLKIVAHASPPIQANPGFRQYDFFVDGQSFFTFPKVFRLGLAANDPRAVGSPRSVPSLADGGRGYSASRGNNRRAASASGIASIEAPHNPDEEEAYLREAIKNSLKETHHDNPSSGASIQSAPPPSVGGDLLLDFGAPAPPPGPGAMTPYAGNSDPWGAPTQQPYAALPPSNPPQQQQSSDPWGAQSAYGAPSQGYGAPPPSSNPYGNGTQGGYDYGAPPPASNDPFGAPAPASNPYGAPPQPSSNDPFGAPAPSPNPYGAPPQQPPSNDPFSAQAPQPAPASNNPYGAPPQQQQQMYGQQPPQQSAPTQQDQHQQMYGQPPSQQYSAPPQEEQQQPNPFGSPAPRSVSTSQDYTPASTIGFASPTAQYNAAPQPAPVPEPAPAPTDPAAFTMNSLSGHGSNLVSNEPQSNGGGGTLADQAYGKLMSMDAFDLVKDKSQQKNPFEFSGGGSVASNTTSLADMKKSSSQNQPKKPVMNSAPAGAMVLSNNQQGNFGGYGSQFAMGQQSMGQQPMSGYGQPPMQQQHQQYGQPQMQQYGGQQQFGQPQMQQQYGQQPQYGQPMQQQPYGQQQQYGQSMQQQQWGGM